MMVDMFVGGGGKTMPKQENYGRCVGRKSCCVNHPRINHERHSEAAAA